MIIELKPEQEKFLQEQLAAGLYGSINEVLDAALNSLGHDRRFDAEQRGEAVRRMMEFAERREFCLGEPVTRDLLREGHRL